MPLVELVLATRNEHKILELRSLLTGLAIKILTLKDLPGFPNVPEDGESFEDNAIKKAVEIASWSKRMALADDSGLEVDYLKGAPGVRSARFGGEKASSTEKNSMILKLLEGVPSQNRGARFVCVVAVATSQGDVETASGVCEGYIATQPKGEEGFGFDPIFVIPSYGKTIAELGPEVKNRISHRALALEKAKDILAKQIPS